MVLDSQSAATAHGFQSRGYRLAGMAALAYSLVIIYASLLPFTDWRAPGQFGAFLLAPWPRWITVDDIVFNFAAYIPLGFLLASSLRARWAPAAAVIIAGLVCAALSLTLESVQQYLPARIASNVDFLVNCFGGTGGALLAPLFSPGRRLGHALASLRSRGFVSGPHGDAVLVLAGLWLLTQLHAPVIALGNGDLRSSIAWLEPLRYTPAAYLLAEAGVVMLNVTGFGLLLASAARDTGTGYWRALMLLITGACMLRAAAAVFLLRTENSWSWLTPGFGLGLAAALVALTVLLHIPSRASSRVRAALALLALFAAVMLVNMVPENPYRPAPSYLLAGRAGHLLNFAGIMRALSDIWPFLAMLFLLFSLPGRHRPEY